ncbi:MAG: transposase [Geobacteraceae bacterium]|nr:MAG: transposase [Geobacteraceae bacterium]
MMSLKSKRELLEVVRPRYLKASKLEKQKMLDEFTSATGYHRKYAIRVLKNQRQVQNHLKGKTKTYKPIYGGEVVQVLEQIWEIYGQICSKRLQPMLPEAMKVLERCKEINITKDTKELLLKISSASIDRCLRPIRCKLSRGLGTTKPGSLLKSLIPVQTFTAWDEEQPGFMEIDLVAHCGNTTEGQYLNTLTCTDLSTGWTDVTALAHRSQQAVSTAIHHMRQRLPFPLLGIDSDNGSEFINDTLYRYCLDEKITFTRSRPYKKNDQAHVEQKNWSVVRHTVGYDRWETDQEFSILESIHADLRLYINFFQPSFKLIAKERIGNKTIKRYDTAKTPYQRILERKDIPLETKARLMNLYVQLNPAELRRSIDQTTAKLWKISR